MVVQLDPVEYGLVNAWQRGFPLVSRPFAKIGTAHGLAEEEVISRLARLRDVGVISRVGATCRPNTAGASTLAAIAAPEEDVDLVAEIVGREEGVNHSYLRQNRWNLWFVATGPDRAQVDATLARIGAASGLDVLDLRLVRPFNVDLGFSLDRPGAVPVASPTVALDAVQGGDRQIIQALSSGLEIVAKPFAALAATLKREEDEVIARIAALAQAGILSRIGVIVRHRALGWLSNAMVVWQVPEEEIAVKGPALAAQPGVTLCYQRRTDPEHWPYSLYCMIHARSRSEALETLDRAAAATGLAETPREILFSLRCFKQTGALIRQPMGAAA